MSEQTKMEVQLANEWFPCEYVSPLDEAQSRVVVYRDDGQFHVVFLDEGLSHRLRTAPATEAEDGWEVKDYDRHTHIGNAGHRFYVQRGIDIMTPSGIVDMQVWSTNGDDTAMLFDSESLALAALAKWREKNRKFVPTPHEPVEGVTLWNNEGQSDYPTVCVDGINSGIITTFGELSARLAGDYKTKNRRDFVLNYLAALAAFRDRIRAERNKPATKDAKPSPFTSEEEARIREIWLDMSGPKCKYTTTF